MTLRARLVGCLVGLACLVAASDTPRVARAEPTPEEVTRGIALYDLAVEQMQNGYYAEACPKLEEAIKLVATAYGAMKKLGECYERLNRLASAHGMYRLAAEKLGAANDPEAAQWPSEQAERLRPIVSTLELIVPESVADARASLFRDNVQIGHGSWNSPLAIDGGEYVIRLEVPGKQPYEMRVTVQPQEDHATAALPELSALPDAPKVEPPKVEPPKTETPPDPPRATPVWAWAVGGAGIAAIAVGAGFRIDGYLVEEDQADECGENRDACPSDYDVEGTNAQKERDYGVFVGMTVAGSLAVGIGIVGLVVHAVDAPSTKKQVGPASPAPALTSIAPWFDGRRAVGIGAAGTF